MKRFLLVLLLILAYAAPSLAQFADQATFAGTSGGIANAQTLALSNVTVGQDINGVLIKFIPGNTNTGPTSMNVSGTGTVQIQKPSPSGLVNLTGGELQAGQPAAIMLVLGSTYTLMSPSSLIGTSGSLFKSSLSYSTPTNLGLTASASAGALTITVTAADGSVPVASNPVLFYFGSGGSTSITPSLVSLTVTLAFTISSGNTFGCVTTAVCRLWLLVANDGGVARLCATNLRNGNIISPLTEASLITTTGTAGGSTFQIPYCSAAITSRAWRIIGYLEAVNTAGAWANPTVLQLFGPGISKPGSILQTAQLTAASSISIAPNSAANIVKFSGSANLSAGPGVYVTQNYTRTSPGSATLASHSCGGNASGGTINCGDAAVVYDGPNTTGTATYGMSNAGVMILEEIQGALPEPANDDGTWSLRMTG